MSDKTQGQDAADLSAGRLELRIELDGHSAHPATDRRRQSRRLTAEQAGLWSDIIKVSHQSDRACGLTL